MTQAEQPNADRIEHTVEQIARTFCCHNRLDPDQSVSWGVGGWQPRWRTYEAPARAAFELADAATLTPDPVTLKAVEGLVDELIYRCTQHFNTQTMTSLQSRGEARAALIAAITPFLTRNAGGETSIAEKVQDEGRLCTKAAQMFLGWPTGFGDRWAATKGAAERDKLALELGDFIQRHRALARLAQQPAAVVAGAPDLKAEIVALCEDTEQRYAATAEQDRESKQGAFARGRIAEAKSIRNAICEVARSRLTPPSTAWLVERSDLEERPVWMAPALKPGDHRWTANANEATRFASKKEAEAACCGGHILGPLRVTEHAWIDPVLWRKRQKCGDRVVSGAPLLARDDSPLSIERCCAFCLDRSADLSGSTTSLSGWTPTKGSGTGFHGWSQSAGPS